jgi:hypothetical protein
MIPTQMKIATWNLDGVRPGLGARSERIRNHLGRVDADVWVLTESHPEFAPPGGYECSAVSVPAPDRVSGGRWVVIWVRKGHPAEALVLAGEPERATGVCIARPRGRFLFVFGTVLPWRGDTRHTDYRGGRAFVRSLAAQAKDWDAALERHPHGELCIAGDFNQELTANGPVGTRVGREAFDRFLKQRSLRCVTGGNCDPLRARGWPANIDHVLLSRGLSAKGAVRVWPEQYPLPRNLSDHHGLCVTVVDA